MDSILWFLLIPFAITILTLLAMVILSQQSGKSLSDILRIVTDPNAVANKEYQEQIIPLDSNPTMKDNGFDNDPIPSQLDNDAHRWALRQWCGQQGWIYNGTLNVCDAPNKEACEMKSSDIIDYNNVAKKPFLRYINGNCINTLQNQNMCQLLQQIRCQEGKTRCTSACTDALRPSTKFEDLSKSKQEECIECQKTETCAVECQKGRNLPLCQECLVNFGCEITELPYVPADVKCDETRLCTADNEPTCALTSEYCTQKGVEFDADNNGDCYIGDVQATAEMIFGQNITREYKKAVQNLANDCRDFGPFSRECIKSTLIVLDGTVLYNLAVDSIVVGYAESVQNYKDDCLNGAVNNGKDALECIGSTLLLFPPFWALEKAVELLNGILLSIEGMPNLTQLAFQAIVDYGGPALDAVYKFGSDAGESIYLAGQSGIQAIEALFDGRLKDFSNSSEEFILASGKAVAYVAVGVFCMINAGPIAAVAIGLQILDINAKEVADVIQQAFINGGESLANFISEEIIENGIEGLRSIFKKIGIFFNTAGEDFVNGLKTIAGRVADIAQEILPGVQIWAQQNLCFGFC
jgi:hypothetical protein